MGESQLFVQLFVLLAEQLLLLLDLKQAAEAGFDGLCREAGFIDSAIGWKNTSACEQQ